MPLSRPKLLFDGGAGAPGRRARSAGRLRRRRSRRAAVLGLLLVTVLAAPGTRAQPAETAAPGIPVDDETVRQACGSCHRPDDAGRLSRISFRRTTPEGWQQTIRRMVTLNDVTLAPETAREVVRYLSNHLGLAPAEAREAAWEAERRSDDQPYDDADVEETCTQCHSMGRVISQRRTGEEWSLLMAMHRGYYPFTDFQAFRRGDPGGGEPQAVDRAVAHLSERFPFETVEWAAWSATMRPPRLGGAWLLRGHAPGRGAVYGRMTITPVPGAEDEFTTEAAYTYAHTGRRVERTGRAIVYTGFQWRGRSIPGDPDGDELREVMFVERDRRTISGRWFTGGYDETGIDVTLERLDDAPTAVGVHPASLPAGATARVRVHGGNLAGLAASTDAVDLGPGVSVLDVTGAADEWLDLQVRIDEDAATGGRDLVLDRSAVAGALTVYDEVDRIAVTPRAGMARVGGVRFPKQFQQFEARAWHDGPDGEPATDDDLDLGMVDVRWSIEEYAVTIGDDDVRYVGDIGADGLFVPAVDGPNVERSGSRNNVGDVWVVATWPPEAGDGDGLTGRAHLLVTVPLYLRWDPTAVEQP